MFGDIVKVTPSSKVVGDMALYMVQNDLTEEDVYNKGETLDFPDSVIELFEGQSRTTVSRIPKKNSRDYFKREKAIKVRPGEHASAN